MFHCHVIQFEVIMTFLAGIPDGAFLQQVRIIGIMRGMTKHTLPVIDGGMNITFRVERAMAGITKVGAGFCQFKAFHIFLGVSLAVTFVAGFTALAHGVMNDLPCDDRIMAFEALLVLGRISQWQRKHG
jgi:hypothetical protein